MIGRETIAEGETVMHMYTYKYRLKFVNSVLVFLFHVSLSPANSCALVGRKKYA